MNCGVLGSAVYRFAVGFDVRTAEQEMHQLRNKRKITSSFLVRLPAQDPSGACPRLFGIRYSDFEAKKKALHRSEGAFFRKNLCC